MRARVLALLPLAALACQPKAPQLSKEAHALFAKAEQPGPGGALVADLEAMRAAGLLPAAGAKSGAAVLDLLVQGLPAMSAAFKDEPAGPLMLRAAVLAGVMREWQGWPDVMRIGLFVDGDPSKAEPTQIADSVVLALATKGGEKENQELLKGLAALDRAGGQPFSSWQSGNLCIAAKELPIAVCAKAGNGFVALATSAALAKLPAPGPVAASGVLLRLRAEMPGMGRGQLFLEGKDGLRAALALHAEQPEVLVGLEKMAIEGLAAWDRSRNETRTQLAPVLEATKGALAADGEAPATLRSAAAGLTLEKLVDRGGHMTALRNSVKVVRKDNDLTAEASVSKAYMKEITDSGGLYAGVAVTGILAAIAVPNFVKFQCRSKQSEAKANLKGLYIAQQAFRMEQDRWGTTFEEIGFAPEATSYTYCMGETCLPCSKPGCRAFKGDENPCAALAAMGGEGGGFSACAISDLDSDEADPDLWLIDAEGEPNNVRNDCD